MKNNIMINRNFWRRVGLALIIVGATSIASTKPLESTQFFSVLLLAIGTILFLMPDEEKTK
jgi:hypothetical protein